jgi:DNA-binding NarL/FixJ family response regulator
MENSLVTILFTGSARAHLGRLRSAVAEHGGREVRSTEDGLMIVFASAVAAIRCAVDMQRAVTADAGEPALRIGLAAGEPGVDGTDLYGEPVTVASRLCDAAAAGQILAADVVRQVAGGAVATLMAPAEALRLRDVDERVATAEVRWDDLAQLAEPQPPSREISVVVADDERLLRSGFRVILDAEPDIRVVGEAADGRAALDVVRRRRPDVVLMDIRMPELDGLRAAEQIVADPQLQTAVIMLTTFDASAYVYEALRIGASGFLLKDAPADRLLDAVRVVAAGEALLAPSITRRLIEQFARAARPAPGAVPDDLRELTARELDVLRLVAAGMSNAEIAGTLVLGTNTVKTHVARVLNKLGLRDRVQAVVLAYETGLVERELR